MIQCHHRELQKLNGKLLLFLSAYIYIQLHRLNLDQISFLPCCCLQIAPMPIDILHWETLELNLRLVFVIRMNFAIIFFCLEGKSVNRFVLIVRIACRELDAVRR